MPVWQRSNLLFSLFIKGVVDLLKRAVYMLERLGVYAYFNYFVDNRLLRRNLAIGNRNSPRFRGDASF
ncbi:hypothetical protein [Segetibacter sp.]|jgi:hypothetical protein|uniref:hypothetical protein n=1 Tax=Segetibacter sp. TaxID=2231182 RepID=UPI00260163AD|nr:hypothetical protein [Segetibacter sp.]